jgi:nucleoside-diphosphate-sugar epimerase
MRVLVTGGAGFVGSVLVPQLLARDYEVRVLDNLTFGGRGMLPNFLNPRFEFQRGDVRDEEAVRKALQGVDTIIHLAAIVGAPACKKHPRAAEEINFEATRLIDQTRSRQQPIFYASTGSNYGAVVGDLCTEETPLKPLSIYGDTKTRAELLLLDSGETVVYRYATAFGVSGRMRLDLLINDFCYQAKVNRNLIIYEKAYKRTFVHVMDMARSFLYAIDNYDKMRGQCYNVGDESMNFSKEEIARKIQERADYYLHFAEIGTDEDQRNYEVSYGKINDLGYRTSISVEEGIEELLRAMDAIEIKSEFGNI